MAKKQQKGEEGKNTGAATRRAIDSAQAKGLTNAQIGRAVGRDASTIGKIDSGEIDNPPGGLATRINKIMAPKGGKK